MLAGSFFRRAAAPVFFFSVTSFAAPIRVIEDKPDHFSAELTLSDLHVGGGPGGAVLRCSACMPVDRPGAPDLPVARFSLVCPGNPRISLQILASEMLRLPEGVRPYPETPAPSIAKYVKDPALYRAASAFAARVSAPRSLRAVPVRTIEAPLALWDEAARTLTILRRVRVDVSFSGARSRPGPELPSLVAGTVLNRLGGRYLVDAESAGSAGPAASVPRTLRPSASAMRKVSVTQVLPSIGETWIDIKVGDRNVENLDEDRVYAMTGAELRRASPEFVAVKAANLRLYGGPNDTLTSRITGRSRGGTLRQIALDIVDKDGSGTVDDDDTVKFFGHGTSVWKRTPGDSGSIRWEFGADPYSFENHYFLGWEGGAEPPLRIAASAATAPGLQQTSSYYYLRGERDLQSAFCDVSSPSRKDDEGGAEWFWFWLGGCSSPSVTSLKGSELLHPGVDTLEDWTREGNDSLFVGLYFFPSRERVTQVYYGGEGPLAPVKTPGSAGSYSVKTGSFPAFPALAFDSVAFAEGPRAFDAFTVAYRRKPVYRGKPLWIFPERFGERVSYKVAGAPSGIAALRVEAGEVTARLPVDAQGVFTDSLDAASEGRYLIQGETSRLPPGSLAAKALPPAKTALRDLTAGQADADYLIIATDDMLAQAVALRDYRNDPKRALRVTAAVVRAEDIYREFSGGRTSPVAIRDFLRWAYDGWGAGVPGSGKLKYALLFGDGHYDARNINASVMVSAPPDVIPPFEFYARDNEEVASDDFFAWLDSADNSIVDAGLDIAVGRVPAQTPAQAADYVRKVQDYEDPAKAGEWRGRVVLAADDNMQRERFDDMPHTDQTERVAGVIAANEPGVAFDKVYLLDYPVNAAYQKPEASQDLLSLINRGAQVVNYIGHGSSDQWADEVLLQSSDALSRMHNKDRTPMINSFSCTVGRFERLRGEGMSEQFVKQRDGGAIASFSATRESFTDQNAALSLAFYAAAFDSARAVVSVGEAILAAKNGHVSGNSDLGRANDAKYALLGEPVLLLRKPRLGMTITQAPDTLRALDCSVLKGEIAGGGGEGFVNVKIVAGSVAKTYSTQGFTQEAEKRGNILFERTVPYHDHAFATDYFIPRQISFGDTNAQILAFAWDTAAEMEGSAARDGLRIKGTAKSSCPADDGRGPRIRITGCEAKETGDIDFPDHVRIALPYCLRIQVEDSSGGVLSSDGPDEGTTLEIPGSLEPFHPQPGLDDLYRKTYQLTLDARAVRPGPRLLKVSARDGYGNVSRRQVNLDVTLDSSLTAITAYNVPNPLKAGTTVFHFAAGMPMARVDVVEAPSAAPPEHLAYEVRVFDQRGYLVRVFRDARSGVTAWDGTDEWGNRLGNGVYFYQVIARENTSLLDDPNPSWRTEASRRNVLVISR